VDIPEGAPCADSVGQVDARLRPPQIEDVSLALPHQHNPLRVYLDVLPGPGSHADP
jgi:hypothetical protein